jgi:hypothetical protein
MQGLSYLHVRLQDSLGACRSDTRAGSLSLQSLPVCFSQSSESLSTGPGHQPVGRARAPSSWLAQGAPGRPPHNVRRAIGLPGTRHYR